MGPVLGVCPKWRPPGEACHSARPRAPKPALEGLHDAGHPEGRCCGRGEGRLRGDRALHPSARHTREIWPRSHAAPARPSAAPPPLPAFSSAGRGAGARSSRGRLSPQAAPSRMDKPVSPLGHRGCHRTPGPDVLDAPCAPGQGLGTVASLALLETWGAPPRAGRAQCKARGARRRDPSKVGGVLPAGAARPGSTCW